MTTALARQLWSAARRPGPELYLAESNHQEPDADATQGQQIGSGSYDDATQGSQIGSHRYDDATRAR
jgi:hypothetical protein